MENIEWIDEVKKVEKELIFDTQQFLKIESVYDEKTVTEKRPFGANIDKALTHMLEKGNKFGFTTKNIDGYAGVIEYGKGEESVGVLVHIDVVPAGDDWTTPPFSATIRDGRIYARGAIDNKGPAIACLYALMLIKRLQLPISKKIQLIVGTDEERDWRCVDYYFKKEPMPTVGFVPDADFPIIYAEKGITDVEFHWQYERRHTSNSSRLTLLSFHSGERFNVVPDEAVVTISGDADLLKKLKDEFNYNQINGTAVIKNDTLTLTCIGKAAHGSTPEKGKNAALLLVSFLSSYSFQREATEFLSFIKSSLLADVYGKGLNIAKVDDVSGPLTVNAGVFKFDENEATIGLNIRYPVTMNEKELFPRLQHVATDMNATFSIKAHLKPSYVTRDHPLIKTLQSVYERQTGEEATLLTTGGGTYARALQTAVAFGPLFPGREDVAHQKDEYISIDDLLKATALYAEAMYELAK